MVAVEWAEPAFAQLEMLPQSIAFEVIRRVDLLESFPEMGLSLRSRYPELQNCRQLIVKRRHRVIYEYAQELRLIYILAVQHCRQELPTTSELKHSLRRRPSE